MYLNKMISKHVTDTYDAVARRVRWWLTSKREKCHALLLGQRYKDYVIP